MNRAEKIKYLNEILLSEMPNLKSDAKTFPADEKSQRRLLRGLMNVREPKPLDEKFLKVQDELLQEETQEKGVVTLDDLKSFDGAGQIFLWQGDITRLAVDAIVNAANSALLGCFIPGHNCIDNVIHSAAGLQLRDACNKIMQEQGHGEKTGQAKITPAYNLPSKFVIHTVGPIVHSLPVSQREKNLLESCYTSCLNLARENNLKSIAFCCISTGVFHYPNEEAAQTAIKTVRDWLKNSGSDMKIIFNVFKDIDAEIYKKILGGVG